MSLTYFLSVQLDWLNFQKKLLKFLPVDIRRKKLINNRNKLKALKLKSSLQEEVMHNFFGKSVLGVVYDSYNGTLVSSINDVHINHALAVGSFNKNEIEVLKSIIPAESCLYVVGTHIGTLLVPIGKGVRKVVGFEANPKTYQLLEKNVNMNGLHNARVFNYAICDRQTSLKFYLNMANSGGSKIKPYKDNFIYNYDNPETVEVEGDTLDALSKKFSLDLPDCIIMDIEGSEYVALKGAPTCLSAAKLLYMEFVPHHLDNVAGVSIDDFVKAVRPYFASMKIMSQMIEGKNKQYTGEEISTVMHDLYNQGKSEDLLFFK